MASEDNSTPSATGGLSSPTGGNIKNMTLQCIFIRLVIKVYTNTSDYTGDMYQ